MCVRVRMKQESLKKALSALRVSRVKNLVSHKLLQLKFCTHLNHLTGNFMCLTMWVKDTEHHDMRFLLLSFHRCVLFNMNHVTCPLQLPQSSDHRMYSLWNGANLNIYNYYIKFVILWAKQYGVVTAKTNTLANEDILAEEYNRIFSSLWDYYITNTRQLSLFLDILANFKLKMPYFTSFYK